MSGLGLLFAFVGSDLFGGFGSIGGAILGMILGALWERRLRRPAP